MRTKKVRETKREGNGSNPTHFVPHRQFYYFYLVKTDLFFEFCSASLPYKTCAPSITGKSNFKMVAIVGSTLKVLLAYDLPTCPSSLDAYVYFAAQWRTDFEFGEVALLQHSMKLFHCFVNGYFSLACFNFASTS
jgi:hypothetical protein